MKKILYWIGRHWILSLFLIIGSVSSGLNYSGFCIEQGRWLSDEEFLLSVAGHAVRGKYFQNLKKEKGKITEEDIKQFLKENPKCCVFTRGSVGMMKSPFSWLDRITGSIYASGQVEYERTEKDRKRNGWEQDYYQESVTINTCGKSYSGFGWAMKEKEYGASYERYLYNKNKK